jgi:type I restriction enzyme S subunit
VSATHFPSHWTKSTLGQIVVDIEAGKSFRCIEKPPTDDWPGIVKVSAVSWGSFNEHESKTCPDEKLFDPRYRIRPGDLLMSRANTVELVGACVIVGSISKRLMLSDKILRIMLADDLKAWTLWYLRSKEGRAQIEARATGNQLSMRNIGQARILEIEIPLAPDRERLSIVEAIESYLTRLDDAMATLERVQRNLKRYRVSVLKAAVEGRLVPTEAELARAEDREYEPASVLLERILAERRRRWEEAELAKLKAKGKAPKNDKWKAKYVEPAGPVTSELPELPEGWCWATIEQVSSLVTDGDHNPPKRTDEGVPHLTAKSVKGLTLTLDGCSFLSAEGFEKTRSRYEPVEGDLIVTCVGTVGECAIVPPGLVFSADRNLAAVRLLPHGAVAK